LPGQPEQPRVLLAAVPYSLKSSDADTLGGLPASAYMLSANQNRPDGAAGSTVTPLMATAAGLLIADGSTSITGGGTANYLAMFTGASTIANSAIYNSAGGPALRRGGGQGVGTTAQGYGRHPGAGNVAISQSKSGVDCGRGRLCGHQSRAEPESARPPNDPNPVAAGLGQAPQLESVRRGQDGSG